MATGKIVILALALLCYSQVSNARHVRRDTGNAINDLQDALTNLGSVLSQGWHNFTQVVEQHLPSSEEVHNNTLNLARTLGTYAGQLQTEASSHTGELQNLAQNVSSSWNQLKSNLENIDATKTAQEMSQQVQDNVNAFAEEARKFLNSSDHSEGHRM
ncbi:hypothetical protein L9F63_009689 [Diploptera punctata]|uniref:Apolipophorin-III n=1 Tax=Diploptera punctata TaxID=6984 RepID=A0AAD8ER10_DIPPU|nr:hypothetical protein L9F63_009689 [Diploptera punctata]